MLSRQPLECHAVPTRCADEIEVETAQRRPAFVVIVPPVFDGARPSAAAYARRMPPLTVAIMRGWAPDLAQNAPRGFA